MPREFGARDGLVGAFAAGGEGEGGGGEGFARGWVVGDAGDEVDVEGAEDCEGWDWGGHFGRLVVGLAWVGLVLWCCGGRWEVVMLVMLRERGRGRRRICRPVLLVLYTTTTRSSYG